MFCILYTGKEGTSVMEGAKVLQIEFVLVTSNALANKGVGVSFLLF